MQINTVFLIKDHDLRTSIKQGLDGLSPEEYRSEQYCEYSYKFEDDEKEKLFVKQYNNGKLLLQGKGKELYKRILDIIIGLYNIRYPTAMLSIDDYLIELDKRERVVEKRVAPCEELLKPIPLPHIGTDESGKGDYFGPMVVAGVFIDEPITNHLKLLDIKDSKLLSDKQVKERAIQIRTICKGKFKEVEISPLAYNKLYEEFKKEGKNLNHLLAWGHARAIEDILKSNTCHYAIADKFGDEQYILSKLMDKGKGLKLIQIPKAEAYLAVASASILARDRFIACLQKLGKEYGVELPKGAGDTVILLAKEIVRNKGQDILRNIAKLHYKTTQKILCENIF